MTVDSVKLQRMDDAPGPTGTPSHESEPETSTTHAPAPGEGSPIVGLVMGSDSDWSVMSAAAETLRMFDIPFEAAVVSAHRTPQDMIRYGEEAAARGLKVVIAGAGGAAHLPGMLAAVTTLPVIGVPVALQRLDGLDSLLSIVQMPRGVPVATVAINGAANAALLAVRILAVDRPDLAGALREFAATQAESAREASRRLGD